MKSKE